jgi:hypothetical protein
MSFYTEQVKNIQGDTLIITATEPFEQTRGLFELVDWKLGGVLSKILIERSEKKLKDSPILIPSYGKLPVERVIFIPISRAIRSDISRSLRGFGSKNCTISFPKNFKKDLKTYFFEEFNGTHLQWHRIEERKTYDENLIILNKILYK